MSKEISLENGSVKKLFFKFAIPSVFGMLIVSIQLMVDGMFLSRYVGPIGLAAVNISMPLVNFILSIGLMICIGGAVVASIYKGNGKVKRSGEVTTITLILLVIVLQILGIVVLFNLDFFARLLGGKQEVLPLVKSYLIPMMMGAFFYTANVFTDSFTRLNEKPSLSLIGGSIALASNVILDYLFIVKFNMGMAGGAAATILACAIAFFALLPWVKFNKPKKDMKKYKEDMKSIFYNGSSELLTTISSTVSMYIFNIIIINKIGILGVSALTIVNYINMVLSISLYGLSQALQPIVSYNLGARRLGKIKEVLNISLITGGITGVIAFIGVHLGGDIIINIFSKGNEELNLLTKTAIFYVSFSYLLSFANIIASSFLTSIERPIESILVALGRSIIFLIPILVVLPNLIGNIGIWLSLPLAEIISLGVSYILMKKSMVSLKKNCIEQHGENNCF